MFDGVPADQFHQFLAAAASSRTSLPIPLSFSPLHHHHHHQHLQQHHGVSVPVPVPIQIPIPPSSVSAPPPPPAPVITTPAPTPGPTAGFLGCFDLYPSHQILEVVQQPPQHHHHSGLHPGQLHHRPSPSPPADSGNNGNREERNTESLEGEEEDRRRRSIPPPPAAAAADADEIPWSNDEVLTLLRIRSGMENWFPEFTWEHVSRKLEEHGYQRRAEKCKEKFEEESRHFNSMSYNKNYRFFSDLDELYNEDDDQDQQSNHPQPQVSNGKDQDLEREKDHHHHQQQHEEEDAQEEDKMDLSHQQLEADQETENAVTSSDPSRQEGNHPANSLVKETTQSSTGNNKKRKRRYKLEMFKGFCETVVKRIVAQQEDLHNKLIDDMLKRDEECIAREEAWKCQETERFNKEIQVRAQEQVIAGDRQAKIIDLLKKFTTISTGTAHHEQDQNLMRKIEDFFKVRNNASSSSTSVTTSSSEIFPQIHHHNPTTTTTTTTNLLPIATSSSETTPSPKNPQATSSTSVLALTSKSPNENSLTLVPLNKNFSSTTRKSSQKSTEKGQKDTGKRWPRDEVQALINLKCSQTNNSNIGTTTADHDREPKGPLWERISQGMLELGYRRSAKRCKEKWENINKYFRKTKDSNKKRSVESRTCPYFHQLSTLYSQQQQQPGTTATSTLGNNNVVAPSSSDDHVLDKENCPNSPHKKLSN
ncbi:OLC1v1000885C1 [Oldenlandia corymbosa var. corymbosa]|uniref:OLC1v1000885C1 n=1 Tax=Oldenlandia corymbosa var. corymbosa TaxID=529605 RepID=A0AAV1D4A6_OLDCO|nr:OLC1v1000885C1 [Oldenlandia corymbosa var. corymbosa]